MPFSKGKYAIIVIVLVVIIAAALTYTYRSRLPFLNLGTGESVVLMSNGDIYIGHLSRLPVLALRDAYQVVKDSSNNQDFRLIPFKDALWSPDVLYLNQSQVLLTAPVGQNSKIMQTLRAGQVSS